MVNQKTKEKRMKRTIMKTLALLSLLAACATVGKSFDTTHVPDIKNGEQNKAQIEAWFGTPHQKVMPLQRRQITYSARCD